ncbi:hypothetical protein GGI15_003711 [Coemansia interrupta]|uniref:Uncharacterized protein n=1 Tax=Coemansia interrupta TaxID=1126814 RepID=A0A9W8H7T8_9FUNG|nr:hypothetical protein GGI15_003711 [Coemansia interrupta]
MAGDRYLFVNEEDEITAAACLPAKSSRLQIEYNHRGDIMLSRWGGNAFATCEFDDNPVGKISFKTAGPSPYDEVWPMALRLHRVTTE